jgi:hypothetical protein
MGKRQCQLEGCSKWAQGGGTPHCKAHGGGKLLVHTYVTEHTRGTCAKGR